MDSSFLKAKLCELDINLEGGYRYTNDTGEIMYEFHEDAHRQFIKMMHETEFRGISSVRKPKNSKIHLGFGHDEVIYNKNTFTKKSWTGPSGEIAILPKGDGTGLVVSTLQSREFGFGFRKLIETELAQINISRVGKRYIDEAAARKIKGSAVKPPLCIVENPFVQYFEYGANNEGYWSYDHLVVQLEDCIDILKMLYSTDKYEIQIMVDHSCGHDCQREDGLNIKTMNKSYGGS